MKLPEETSPNTVVKDALTKTSSSLDLKMSESSPSSSGSFGSEAVGGAQFRKRSSSLDISAHGNLHRSGSWLQLFVNRSSADFSIGESMSPTVSLENLASCDEQQPRSRHCSGDASSQLANQKGGLVGAQPEQERRAIVRRNSESSLWNWKLFPSKVEDSSRIRRISETDEIDANDSKSNMAGLSRSGGATSRSSSGLWNLKIATTISERDLNALSPSGDI